MAFTGQKSQKSSLQPESVDSLKNLRAAETFYDQRYQNGYMGDEDWSVEKRERVARLVAELPLPRTGRVLDFGCGTGVFTAVLRATLPGWEVLGTDISTEGLERARARLPDCQFHTLSGCEGMHGTFDLIFTHHVLEHVSDLSQTASILAKLLAPSGAMLHILPCGNSGGLVHGVCALVRNGIQKEAGDRFFFEEEGHLRRLTTETLVRLWSTDGLLLGCAYYAEQMFGALSSLTQFDMTFVLDFANPRMAINASAARKLGMLRVGLVGIWALRKPTAVVRNKCVFGCKNARDVVLLAAGLLVYPVSKTADWLIKKLAAWEWSQRRRDPGGSEMYVFLVRQTS